MKRFACALLFAPWSVLLLTAPLGALSSPPESKAEPAQATPTPAPESRSGSANGQPPIIETPAGLRYQDLEVGKGVEAYPGAWVEVHYIGRLPNGDEFDSTVARRRPFGFQLGMGNVIPGWDEGVVGMRVGGRRKLIIPPHLAYGERGVPGVIPPNTELTFEVLLIKVN